MIPSFWTGLGKQCKPRSDCSLEQSDQGLHCLLFYLHPFDKISICLPSCLNFRMITTKLSGVQKLRTFMVSVHPCFALLELHAVKPSTVKILNFRTPTNFFCRHSKIQAMSFYHEWNNSKWCKWNSKLKLLLYPDQTASLGAVWSGSALCHSMSVWKFRIFTVCLLSRKKIAWPAFALFVFYPALKMKGDKQWPGPEVIKLFSCSTQLRSKFILLINVKMPTINGILTFISRINDQLL